MTPTIFSHDVSDEHLTDAKHIGNVLLRRPSASTFIDSADLSDLLGCQFGRSVFFSLISALWTQATAQSVRLCYRSVSVAACASAFLLTIRSIPLVRVWEQMKAVAALAVRDIANWVANIARMTSHQWAGVFAGSQKQRDSIRVKTFVSFPYWEIEPPVATGLEASGHPRPARIGTARLIDIRPEAPNIIFRKFWNWSSLIISHIAYLKAFRLEPSRMLSHPFGSFYFNTSEAI